MKLDSDQRALLDEVVNMVLRFVFIMVVGLGAIGIIFLGNK